MSGCSAMSRSVKTTRRRRGQAAASLAAAFLYSCTLKASKPAISTMVASALAPAAGPLASSGGGRLALGGRSVLKIIWGPARTRLLPPAAAPGPPRRDGRAHCRLLARGRSNCSCSRPPGPTGGTKARAVAGSKASSTKGRRRRRTKGCRCHCCCCHRCLRRPSPAQLLPSAAPAPPARTVAAVAAAAAWAQQPGQEEGGGHCSMLVLSSGSPMGGPAPPSVGDRRLYGREGVGCRCVVVRRRRCNTDMAA
jgi:hypothetical protein